MSEEDELKHQRQILTDCFDLVEQDGEMLKVFRNHFAPPTQTESVSTLIFEACSPKVNPLAEDVLKLPEVLRVPLIEALNNRFAPYRRGPIML